MTQAFNAVLTSSDVKKLVEKQSLQEVDPVGNPKDFEDTYKTVASEIKKLKQRALDIYKYPPLKAKAELKPLRLNVKDIRDLIELIGDSEAVKRCEKVLSYLDKFILAIEEGKIKKVETLKEKLSKAVDYVQAISLDSTNLDYLNKAKSEFKQLKHVKLAIPRNNPPFFMVTAPLVFTIRFTKGKHALNMSPEIERKLTSMLGLEKSTGGYHFIKEATFIAANLEVLNKVQPKLKIEEKINGALMALNSRTSLVPIHEVFFNNNKIRLVWLIPQNSAKFVEALVTSLDKFQIFVNG